MYQSVQLSGIDSFCLVIVPILGIRFTLQF